MPTDKVLLDVKDCYATEPYTEVVYCVFCAALKGETHRQRCPLAAALAAEPPADLVEHMVRRFLGWRLPENFAPDAGISFKREFNENTPHPMKHEPIGTNLFDYTQAKEMVRYMLEGFPAARAASSPASGLDAVFAEIDRLREAVFARYTRADKMSDYSRGAVGGLESLKANLAALSQSAAVPPAIGLQDLLLILNKHKRHVLASPGVGASEQDYAVGVIDDILADLDIRASILRADPTPAPAAGRQPAYDHGEYHIAAPVQRDAPPTLEECTDPDCIGVKHFKTDYRCVSQLRPASPVPPRRKYYRRGPDLQAVAEAATKHVLTLVGHARNNQRYAADMDTPCAHCAMMLCWFGRCHTCGICYDHGIAHGMKIGAERERKDGEK